MSMMLGTVLFVLPMLLFSVLLPVGLVVALQVWLCRRGGRLGLILPCLSLVMSLLISFGVLAFSRVGSGTSQLTVYGENGEVLSQEIRQETDGPVLEPGVLAASGGLFLAFNVPTAVLGGIWLHYKGRRELEAEMRRMRLEDLS